MARLGLMLCLAAALIGCGSGEPEHVETAAEKQAINQSAGAWNAESVAAFKKAHERAKSGADEETNGAPKGQKTK